MTCWRSSSNSLLLAAVVLGTACAGTRTTLPPSIDDEVVVLLPPANLAGRPVPLVEVDAELERALRAAGVPLASRDSVEAFLARHRVRYTGGLSGTLAAAARDELGATSVLIATVDGWSRSGTPSVAVSFRLVSAEDPPRVLWMGSRGHSGDESPGLFEQGVETDLVPVRDQVFRAVSDALAAHLRGAKAPPPCGTAARFAPEAVFVSATFGHQPRYSVVVMPFVNETTRVGAGELMAAEFARQLQARSDRFEVREPGVLRDELLRYRIAVGDGISLDTARVVLELAKADLIVTGTVRRWEEGAGAPVVEFTAHALERRDNTVAWQVSSWGAGDEGVFFFDAGKVANTRALTCRMVRSAVERITPQPARVR